MVWFGCVVLWREHRGRHFGVVSLVLGGRVVVWSVILCGVGRYGFGHVCLTLRPLDFDELKRLFG